MSGFVYYAFRNLPGYVYRFPTEGSQFGEWASKADVSKWSVTGVQPSSLLARGARRLDAPPSWVESR